MHASSSPSVATLTPNDKSLSNPPFLPNQTVEAANLLTFIRANLATATKVFRADPELGPLVQGKAHFVPPDAHLECERKLVLAAKHSEFDKKTKLSKLFLVGTALDDLPTDRITLIEQHSFPRDKLPKVIDSLVRKSEKFKPYPEIPNLQFTSVRIRREIDVNTRAATNVVTAKFRLPELGRGQRIELNFEVSGDSFEEMKASATGGVVRKYRAHKGVQLKDPVTNEVFRADLHIDRIVSAGSSSSDSRLMLAGKIPAVLVDIEVSSENYRNLESLLATAMPQMFEGAHLHEEVPRSFKKYFSMTRLAMKGIEDGKLKKLTTWLLSQGKNGQSISKAA